MSATTSTGGSEQPHTDVTSDTATSRVRMNDLTPEAIAERWLSLTNEQRSELLAQRRENQLDEKALDQVHAEHDENE
jgi:hypothetical protein